jgi:putative transposase
VDDRHGNLPPGVPEAISRTVPAAGWSGLTTGYLTLAGSYRLPRRFLACYPDQGAPRPAPGTGEKHCPVDSEPYRAYTRSSAIINDVNLRERTRRRGVYPRAAYRRSREGALPVPAAMSERAGLAAGQGRGRVGRFTVPDGWTVQAFQFALECTPEQEAALRRHFGARRYARNWAVRTLKEDITRYRETGEQTAVPSLAGLRKRWNQAKDTECVDAETGQAWWPHISKEAFSDGIKGAVDAYWNWQTSRVGTRKGRRAGFPRFARKGRDRDRVTFTTGAIRVEPDRRHVTLPKIGTVRVHENTRRLQRLIAKGRARILAATVSRKGTRLVVAFRVLLQRPVQPRVTLPGSRAGVDVGVRVLATVANSEGEVLERLPNPRPLEAALKQLRHLSRERSRRTRGSSRYQQTQRKITRLHRRAADIRAHHVHVLTTRLAMTHGEIVVEGLDVAGMLRQKGLSGARARRRGLSDSALGETRRQLAYKTGWHGSRLIVADRWYPSSQTCHACAHVQDIGWAEHWTCTGCGTSHQRDDNAAINLARYEEPQPGDSALGPVRATVKRGADRKTRPVRAGGEEARKGPSRQAGKQPRDGVPEGDSP